MSFLSLCSVCLSLHIYISGDRTFESVWTWEHCPILWDRNGTFFLSFIFFTLYAYKRCLMVNFLYSAYFLLQDESKLYIFLELVTKGSLAKLYGRYNLRDSQVSAYTRQILHGLKYLHDRNVIHRWFNMFVSLL